MKAHAPNAPILVVSTHVDLEKGAGSTEGGQAGRGTAGGAPSADVAKTYFEQLRVEFPQVLEKHLRVSSKDADAGDGIEELRHTIARIAFAGGEGGLGNVTNKLPRMFIELENKLAGKAAAMVAANEHPIVPWDEMCDLAARCGFKVGEQGAEDADEDEECGRGGGGGGGSSSSSSSSSSSGRSRSRHGCTVDTSRDKS